MGLKGQFAEPQPEYGGIERNGHRPTEPVGAVPAGRDPRGAPARFPYLASADPATLTNQTTLAPVVVVEQLRLRQQDPAVVRPRDHRLISELFGLFHQFA